MFCVILLILIFFIHFGLDKMIFSILQVSRDRERLLKKHLSDILLRVVSRHCFETSEVGYSRNRPAMLCLHTSAGILTACMNIQVLKYLCGTSKLVLKQ